jgi:hypothetical protein
MFYHCILSTQLLFLTYITYTVIVKPLNKMLYYPVTHWRVFPIIVPMMVGYEPRSFVWSISLLGLS